MSPSSSELMSAVGHPLRRRILQAYLEGSVESASASELAEAMDERVGRVAYHLKVLAMCDLLQPVQGGSRNAVEEPHYGWALGVEADWLRLALAAWSAP